MKKADKIMEVLKEAYNELKIIGSYKDDKNIKTGLRITAKAHYNLALKIKKIIDS